MTERETAKAQLMKDWKRLSGKELSERMTQYFKLHVVKDVKQEVKQEVDPLAEAIKIFDGRIPGLEG